MNNQDFNTEFKSFLGKYIQNNPNQVVSDIAARRNLDPKQVNASLLHSADADYGALRVWRSALEDLEQLINPMTSTLMRLAFKYFPDSLADVQHMPNTPDKEQAVFDALLIDEGSTIDNENALKNLIKEAICEKEYTINKVSYPLFKPEDAQANSPETLCENLKVAISDMYGLFDSDAKDRSDYKAATENHTYVSFFKALAEYLNSKSDTTMGTAGENGNIASRELKYVYEDNPNPRVVCRTIKEDKPVLTVSANRSYSKNTGAPENLICNVRVDGINLPDKDSITSSGATLQLDTYKAKHRAHGPSENGEYSIVGVRGDTLPAVIYSAVQDWYATAMACDVLDKSYDSARDKVGKAAMYDFDLNESNNIYFRDKGNTKGKFTTQDPEIYKTEHERFKAKAAVSTPKFGQNKRYSKHDITSMLNNVVSKVSKTMDVGAFLDPSTLHDIFDVDDGEPK